MWMHCKLQVSPPMTLASAPRTPHRHPASCIPHPHPGVRIPHSASAFCNQSTDRHQPRSPLLDRIPQPLQPGAATSMAAGAAARCSTSGAHS